MRNFRDFDVDERRNYITLSTGEYYPDILVDACRLYSPVLETFSSMLRRSESSSALFIIPSMISLQLPWFFIRPAICPASLVA